MENENKELHIAVVNQMKEMATDSYNKFYRAYETLNDNKEKSKEIFLSIINSNDLLISSLDFYNDTFFGLNRSEDYLYIGQILSLQVKASHNLMVIAQSELLDEEIDKWNQRKNKYKIELYFYYLLAQNMEKIGDIILAFVKDAGIDETSKQEANKKYQSYITKHQ